MPDIDIDFADRELALAQVKHVIARLDANKKHNTGVYVQPIPCDPVSRLSTIDYKTAEDRGYFKLDFLNVSIYNGVRDRAHLKKLMEADPVWDLLEDETFVDMLFHVNGHSSILKQMKPRSIEQLASVLAIIRPAKRHLVGKDWKTVEQEVWIKPEGDEYYFKKAHAVAYAHVIVVQMNLICENLANSAD